MTVGGEPPRAAADFTFTVKRTLRAYHIEKLRTRGAYW
jgi:hypothetical protein